MNKQQWAESLRKKIDILSAREQIQEDLISFLSTQFDDDGQNDEVQRIACDIVISNFAKLITKEEV